jgi:hypothetical protein
MRYNLARALQFISLFVILPLGVAGNLAGKLSLNEMLAYAGVGVLIFLTGWLLQQSARPR